MSLAPPSRVAVITIQGGGIYGLNLLGQLKAVTEDHGYGPLALAGTSAGAIVATLLWAGYTPSEIGQNFIQLGESNDQELLSWLGPFDSPPFGLGDLKNLWSDTTSLLNAIMTTSETPKGWKQRLKAGVRSCGTPVRQGSRSIKALMLARRLAPHLKRRGFFRGQRLEDEMEKMLRARPDVPKGLRPGGLLTFRDFTDLAAKNPDSSYRPPLFLTATNLSTRRMELISSLDERYADVSVSRAVRASAGFPVFLRPVELAPDGGWFVDGGVVSNFPVWAFSEAFRQQLRESEVYDTLAPLPWIRIGLRVVEGSAVPESMGQPQSPTARIGADVSQPYAFFKAIGSMLSGAARNQLEEIISARSARAIVVRQVTSGEGNGTAGESQGDFLAMDSLTGVRVRSMIEAGYKCADEHLKRIGSPGIHVDGDITAAVVSQLRTLVSRSEQALGRPAGDLLFRANVFVPTEDFRMKLVFSYNMDRDGDREMEFPDLRSGLTGFCYMSRKPQLCNLKRIRELRESGDQKFENLFGMDPKLQSMVIPSRTWLASVPIFDPYEVTLSPNARQADGVHLYPGEAYHGIETELDGAVLGVLNLDSGLDFNALGMSPDPKEHFREPGIQFILSLMQATAFSIGRALIRAFPSD